MNTQTGARSQIVHINSFNRTSGDIHDFKVDFSHAMLKLNDVGRITVEPIQCVLNRSYYTVDETNNLFQVFDGDTLQDYVIPSGFWNVKTFHDLLQNTFFPDWVIGYDLFKENKYYFEPPDDGKTYKFIFTTFASYLLGFPIGTEVECSYATPLKSQQPVKMNLESVILVNTNLPKAKHTAIDNVLTREMRESNVLIKVPVNVPPFDNLVWRANSRDIISFELTSPIINEIRFWLTDEYGREIKPHYDWTLTLRFDYYEGQRDVDKVLFSLDKVRDYLRFLVLEKEVKKQKTNESDETTKRRTKNKS